MMFLSDWAVPYDELMATQILQESGKDQNIPEIGICALFPMNMKLESLHIVTANSATARSKHHQTSAGESASYRTFRRAC